MDTDLSAADASFWGEDAEDKAGFSVSGAGDVNGDGYDDILIGADGDEEGGGGFAGQAYLILGKASGWSMDTDLSTADASFWGEDASDNAAWSVSGAGDVNGDGYDDILIGAFGDDDGGGYAGQTYLILGTSGADWGMDHDLSNPDASFWGEDAGDYSAYSVSGAGDVNGDGYDDFLIGAPYDNDGGSSAGQVYLLSGDGVGLAVELASFEGHAAGDRIVLTWVTGTELDNLGFNVYREHGEDRTQVNTRVIYATGDATSGGRYTFTDRDVRPGAMYSYYLEEIALDGRSTRHGPISVTVPTPAIYALRSHPNPFNPETTIQYDLPEARTVHLAIYSQAGQLIRTLVDLERPAGSHSVMWNGQNDDGRYVASSVYLCRIQAGSYRAVRKLVLTR